MINGIVNMICVLQSAGLSALMKISPAVRMLPSLPSPFNHQIILVCMSHFLKSSNLLLCNYHCNDQENPKPKRQSQDIHYSFFCLQ